MTYTAYGMARLANAVYDVSRTEVDGYRTTPNPEEVRVFAVPEPLLLHAAVATRHAARFPAQPDAKGNFPEPKFSIPPRASRLH